MTDLCRIARDGTSAPMSTPAMLFSPARHAAQRDRMGRLPADANFLAPIIADTLLDHLGPRTIVLADKAYDADRIRELIQDQGVTPNIPPKSNRRWKPCFSKRLYRERNLIERFFSRLKHFRRVATRYDKLAANFLAMVQIASMRLWLRAYESTA